jgi:hypothetical protein
MSDDPVTPISGPQPPPTLSTARDILNLAESAGLTVRLVGGLAFWERCAEARDLLARTVRSGDIDLVVRARDRRRFERLLCSAFGVLLDPQLGAIPSGLHARFYLPDGTRFCEVNYDYLSYCHSLDLRARLSIDQTTIPLAELLLSKLQIVSPGDKDTLDIVALVLEHAFGNDDGEAINLPVILGLCTSDWALDRTVRLSICNTCLMVLDASFIDTRQAMAVLERLIRLIDALERARKSLRWRVRALRGSGGGWYRTPETLPDPRPEDLRSAV